MSSTEPTGVSALKQKYTILTLTYPATGRGPLLGMCTFGKFVSSSSPTPPVCRLPLCLPEIRTIDHLLVHLTSTSLICP